MRNSSIAVRFITLIYTVYACRSRRTDDRSGLRAGVHKADVASPLTSSQTERGSRADAVDAPSWSDAARQVHVHHHKALDLTNDLIRSGC